jgi:hypothetical protein
MDGTGRGGWENYHVAYDHMYIRFVFDWLHKIGKFSLKFLLVGWEFQILVHQITGTSLHIIPHFVSFGLSNFHLFAIFISDAVKRILFSLICPTLHYGVSAVISCLIWWFNISSLLVCFLIIHRKFISTACNLLTSFLVYAQDSTLSK